MSDEAPVILVREVPRCYADALRTRADARARVVADAAAGPVELALVACAGAGDTGPFERVRAELPGVPVVAMGEDFDVDSAVRLMRAGAIDVIRLPASPGRVAARVLMALGEEGASREALLGSSGAMRRLRGDLQRVAPTDCPVLLCGETGTGKGLAARALHAASRRRRGSFVHVDCAALAPTVIESELFGHERGAFTGAHARRRGRVEQAGSGTLFLDEIAELEPALQVKLLRVLQDRRFERVGGSATLEATARIVAASNRDLREEVASGAFRADLYFRLKVFVLEVPPLRERSEDLPELAGHMLAEAARRHGLAPARCGEGFCEALAAYGWPGNVRELRNLLERLAVTMPGGVLRPDALEGLLEEGWAPRANAPSFRSPREELAATLRETGGNVSRAARRLGVSRGTLRYRIERHGLGESIPRD